MFAIHANFQVFIMFFLQVMKDLNILGLNGSHNDVTYWRPNLFYFICFFYTQVKFLFVDLNSRFYTKFGLLLSLFPSFSSFFPFWGNPGALNMS